MTAFEVFAVRMIRAAMLGVALGAIVSIILVASIVWSNAQPVHTEATPDTYWARAYYPKDGPSEAELLGQQFTFAWDEHDYGTILVALRLMDDTPQVYGDFFMLRQKRVLAKVASRHRAMWVGANGEAWLMPIQMTLPETILTGIALSRYWAQTGTIREWLVDEPVVVAGDDPDAILIAIDEVKARKEANDRTTIAWTSFMNRLVEPKAQALMQQIASKAQPNPHLEAAR